MRRKAVWLGLLVLMGSTAVGFANGSPAPDLTVHEWGTFLSMQGSDGVTLDGMYHEEHALPSFVHTRSRDQLRMPVVILKGETPVIYFYTQRPQQVRVDVRFPRGVWTQWYPQASLVGPPLDAAGSPDGLQDGHISWEARVDPDASLAARLPASPEKALWRYAREVDAAFVTTQDETRAGTPEEVERFLFYRGLGRAPLPLKVASKPGGSLELQTDGRTALRHLFVLRVENGKGAYRCLPELGSAAALAPELPSMKGALPLPEFTRKISDDLAARLTASGLYPKEARAMVNTWRGSYFGTDGVRVLFVLPQEWTDSFIPMQLDPQPQRLVRVMVGRVEVLTPERERRAEQAFRDLGSSDTTRREAAFTFLREQGRYAEPVIRRVLRSTTDPALQSLCRRLLTTDFVTELRWALNDTPASGRSRSPGERPLAEQRVYLRAQLASLLREAGLDDEARKESAFVLEGLKSVPHPPMERPGARHYLRAYARALEGAGDDRATLQAYERFVRFGSQVKGCGGCHGLEGPRNMAWFRDWWAGRKYAGCAVRAGIADQEIQAQQAALERSRTDTAAQMLLAYLYEAKGQSSQAEEMWARIAPGSEKRTAAARINPRQRPSQQ